MVKLMIGRDLKAQTAPPARPAGSVALETVGVETDAHPGRKVDLQVRHGEILGVAGLVGAGRTELARAIFRIDPVVSGKFLLHGETFVPRNSADAVKRGIFLVPEDRKRSGLLLDLSVAENISLPDLNAHSRNFLLTRQSEIKTAEVQRRDLDIKVPQVTNRAGALSGGNQQKVVLGKWLAMAPKVLIFDEPTRGVASSYPSAR